MNTLTDLYNQQLVPLDQELEKQASVMVKQAEEEEFAGRIMARGFADELNKLAAVKDPAVMYGAKAQANPAQGATSFGGAKTTRTSAAPAVPAGGGRQAAADKQFGGPKKGPAGPSLSSNPLKGYKSEGQDKSMAFLNKKPKALASNP